VRSRILTLLFLAAVTVAPLATTSPADSAGADPDFHRPQVGDCYDYGLVGLYANSGPKNKVSCDESHRALLIAAPRVNGKIDRKDPEATFDKIGVRCYRALYKMLGGTPETRALTAYGISYYIPRQTELDKGARWARCDLLLFGGTKLMPLPDPLLPAVPDDSTALCLLDEDLAATVCTRKHKFRATGVVTVDTDAYPGEKKLNRIGYRKCDSRTTSTNYLWRYPSEAAWRAGKHLVTCYTKTRD
jgi:hypothetical protein